MGLLTKKIKIKTPIRYKPETKDELGKIIVDLLKKGQTNLNCIDVTKITDMSWMFSYVNDIVSVKDIDISEWDVSNVTDMIGMFFNCTEFDSDLSNWNTANIQPHVMYGIFDGCNSLTKIPDWYNGTN